MDEKKGDAVMRIEAYNQVAQLYKTNKTTRTQSTASTSQARDAVQISRAGQDYQIAKQAVANASDVREDKVADLKAKMKSGTYSVDTGDFASKLLEKYNQAY